MNHKPLGGKAYGSTGHLQGSKLGDGDHHVDDGKNNICTVKTRGRQDRVIVTEKADGTNVAIAKLNGDHIPLTRAGYRADSSPYEQHHLFHEWALKNANRWKLEEGEIIHGEWMALAHGTIYDLPHEPFIAFSMSQQKARLPWDEFVERAGKMELTLPRVVSDGPALPISDLLPLLQTSGHGARGPAEGAVYRVETHGKFSFIAKYVRHDFQGGQYLKDITGHEDVWQWRPE